MLTLIPRDEIVMLRVVYEFNAESGTTYIRSPMSRPMPLRHAVGLAMSFTGTGAKVTITARGITYSDTAEFRKVWARRGFFQGSQ